MSRRVLFNDPHSDPFAIVDDFVAAVRRAPKGSLIRVVTYSLDLPRVSNALLDAHKRGATVQVLVDSHSRTAATKALHEGLTVSSWLRWTQGAARGAHGVTHSKIWSVRYPNGATKVYVGSTNLTGHCAHDQYADMVVIENESRPYAIYESLFARQAEGRTEPDPWMLRWAYRLRVEAYPWIKTKGANIDPRLTRLSDIALWDQIELDVAAFAFNDAEGVAIAEGLVDLMRKGAKVRVLYGPGTGPRVLDTLHRAGVPTRSAQWAHGIHIHHKFMTARLRSGRLFGRQTRHFVWTGSDNLTGETLRNEETTIRVRSWALWSQYRAHFNGLWAVAK